jgi:hypothetical protein
MVAARVFFRASVFSVRTSEGDQCRSRSCVLNQTNVYAGFSSSTPFLRRGRFDKPAVAVEIGQPAYRGGQPRLDILSPFSKARAPLAFVAEARVSTARSRTWVQVPIGVPECRRLGGKFYSSKLAPDRLLTLFRLNATSHSFFSLGRRLTEPKVSARLQTIGMSGRPGRSPCL